MNLTTLELDTIYFYFIKLGHFIPTGGGLVWFRLWEGGFASKTTFIGERFQDMIYVYCIIFLIFLLRFLQFGLHQIMDNFYSAT